MSNSSTPAASMPPSEPTGNGESDEARDAIVRSVEQQLSVLWRRGRSISHRLSRQVHPDMDPAAYGLLTILRKEGPMRLTELAAYLGVGKPSVSRQITFLERIGLVVKRADPLDGRAQTISLTESGEEKMHHVQDARREVFRERLGEWPVVELEALAQHMAKLNTLYERDGFSRDE
ncbi:MarR family winged helix-turn-helix transcriptional regulator [Pseudarthrobacter sp. J1738]|uniref:MarR family winged helix-turn-helix transcriptional regulator n=1 Tax=unclassified Pseudarthrobacter TaxID=2647000 RepID=UPI003D2BBC2B